MKIRTQTYVNSLDQSDRSLQTVIQAQDNDIELSMMMMMMMMMMIMLMMMMMVVAKMTMKVIEIG